MDGTEPVATESKKKDATLFALKTPATSDVLTPEIRAKLETEFAGFKADYMMLLERVLEQRDIRRERLRDWNPLGDDIVNPKEIDIVNPKEIDIVNPKEIDIVNPKEIDIVNPKEIRLGAVKAADE